MEFTIITFCLIGAVFANPISYNVLLESNELEVNSTESLSVSQSSENNTSEIQSSQENSSSQSSESDSNESTSEDKTSEESQSDEDTEMEALTETRDNSMGSEENVRKNWVPIFAVVAEDLSAEGDNSTEVKGQAERLNAGPNEEGPTRASTTRTFKQMIHSIQGPKNMPLMQQSVDNSDTTSESADTTDSTAATSESADTTDMAIVATAASDSSKSSSSESNETSETSETSQSTEDSNSSDSAELETLKDCVNGSQSCESEEYFFQDVGDDPHYAAGNLMVPDEDDRELRLRR